jgi:lipoic acid synthetase
MMDRSRSRLPGETELTPPERRPEWIRLSRPSEPQIEPVRSLMRAGGLHTVCEEAMCPNLGLCWSRGTATFLILGNICTRSCGFCGVRHGRPAPIDRREPGRVARAVQQMGLRHAVITSVNRDDQPDGGASVFAEVVDQIQKTVPGCTVEILIPDFKGRDESLRVVMEAHPEILGHNLETVPRLFHKIQPQDRYAWAEAVLRGAKRINPDQITKSGLMLGLGETFEEVVAVLRDLRAWGVDIVTLGQYLQPSRRHLPVERFYPPQEFAELRKIGLEELGFRWVESSPLVRSSYRAEEQVRALIGKPADPP